MTQHWTPAQALDLLEKLETLGLSDTHFKAVHPMGDSIKVYRTYSKGLTRGFNAGSSSHSLCDRLQRLVDNATPGMSTSEWKDLVDDVIERHPIQSTRMSGTSTKNASDERPQHSRLERPHLKFIATQIEVLLPTAANTDDPMNRVARWLIKNLLWRWTVDAVASDGHVRINGARNTLLWPISKQAAGSGDAKIIHEHVVPRDVIATHLIAGAPLSTEQVIEALSRHCLAAVITTQEDAELNKIGLRDKMPTGWQWGNDPWARYRQTGLYDSLEWPKDWAGGFPPS